MHETRRAEIDAKTCFPGKVTLIDTREVRLVFPNIPSHQVGNGPRRRLSRHLGQEKNSELDSEFNFYLGFMTAVCANEILIIVSSLIVAGKLSIGFSACRRHCE